MTPEKRQERIDELFYQQYRLKEQYDWVQDTPNAGDHEYAEMHVLELELAKVAEELLQLDAPLNSDERAELAELLDEGRDFDDEDSP